MKHCFLIRDPAQVITSYAKKMPTIDGDAIGIRRQAELFEQITEVCGRQPAVIDSNDVLKNPGEILSALCDDLAIEFHREAMLQWPTGRRDSDGVWASHWYHTVENSTGFGEYREQNPELAGDHLKLAKEMQGYYDQLAALQIRP